MPQEAVLEFEKVSLKYGQTWALRDISLTLRPGETRVIFGQAGAGKTTLLKAVIGLIPVDEGKIRLFGEDVRSLGETRLYALRSRAGFLFQEGGLFDSLTVGENVEYPLLNQQSDGKDGTHKQDGGEEQADERVRDALRFVELERTFDSFPSSISGGMRRRVGIARAIVTEPPLILYDSPTAGLDPITANTIMSLVAKERDVRNSTSLIVTHRYQDGEIMAGYRWDDAQEELVAINEEHPKCARTKFIVMKDGSIVFQGTRKEMESSRDDYVKKFIRHE